MKSAILVAVMSAVTILLRFLPFAIFRKKIPSYIQYLGKVLPSAIIGMLVIYCLKDTKVFSFPYGIPELTAALCLVCIHIWKRNSLVSILSATILYMVIRQAFC